MTPRNYKGLSKNQVEGINAGKYPTCSWITDVYTNWLTQNGVNIAWDLISSTGGIATSPLASTPEETGGRIGSGLRGIVSTLIDIHKQSLVPDQAKGNINCGDVVTAEGTNDFIFYNMSIKAETAKIIDDFFSMYGYKTNLLKIPNITGRLNWNYIKTIDCNLLGNIPQNDLQQIKKMFDNGLTLWHNPQTFLDYSQNNDIL